MKILVGEDELNKRIKEEWNYYKKQAGQACYLDQKMETDYNR